MAKWFSGGETVMVAAGHEMADHRWYLRHIIDADSKYITAPTTHCLLSTVRWTRSNEAPNRLVCIQQALVA